MYIVRYWNHDKTDQIDEDRIERIIEGSNIIWMYWDDGRAVAIPIHRIIDIIWFPKEEL